MESSCFSEGWHRLPGGVAESREGGLVFTTIWGQGGGGGGGVTVGILSEGDRGSTSCNTCHNSTQLSNVQLGHLGLEPNPFSHVSRNNACIFSIFSIH